MVSGGWRDIVVFLLFLQFTIHNSPFTIHHSQNILVAVTNDLVTDQRVARTCAALYEAGYRVTLIGRRLDDPTPLQRPYRTVRMRLLFRRKAVFYAAFNLRLFWWLLWHKADLIYANDTDTLPACYWAARLRRKPLFFDAHELFPEVPELVGRPRVQRFWQRIEDRLLPRIGTRVRGTAVTVTQSIADHYRQRYGLEMGVVRNVPDTAAEVAAPPSVELYGRRMLLYQGAVNAGRCVEQLIAAMEYLSDCQLVVAGDGDLRERLERYAATVPWRDRITFTGRLAPERLRGLTRLASLGFVLMENRGLNYYYSLPNRVGDFIQAGVPMLVSDFPELRRVTDAYGVGTVVGTDGLDGATLAEEIRGTLRQWEELGGPERRERFARAAADLTWKHDKKVLLERIGGLLKVKTKKKRDR